MNAPASAPPDRFVPQDPDFAARVRASFGRQKAMSLIGASLTAVEPGYVEIELPYREDLTQQKGYVHGGIVGMIADSACGYAAYSLMTAASGVLTVEYKINLLSPAIGERFVAIGRVKKPGRTLTVCEGDVFAHTQSEEKLVATMLATMMRLST